MYKYDFFLKLWNDEKIRKVQELETRLQTNTSGINALFIRAKRENKISGDLLSKYNQFIEMVKSGCNEATQIANYLNVEEITIYNYMSKARANGELPKDCKINFSFTKRMKQIDKLPYEDHIKELLPKMIQTDIAGKLNICAYMVGDVWDKLNEVEQKECKRQLIKDKEYVYSEIVKIRNEQNITFEEALKQLEDRIGNDEDKNIYLVDLAEIYCILGDEEACNNVFGIIDEKCDASIKRMADARRFKLIKEFNMRKIRAEVKNKKKNHEKISKEELCRKYVVDEKFVDDVIQLPRENEIEI